MPEGVRTTCPYCGVGCGVIAGRDGSVQGDPAHPANLGRLCSKGAALGLTLDDSERLLTPLIGSAPASWDTALDLIASRFSATIAAHGPDSVAFYVSGQCLTEDYYVANKLMKGFIGSGNIDTNSRLCMASSVAGHIRAFGEDVVPGVYADWDEADLVVLVGSNTAWCHPVLFQRLMAARVTRGTRIVVLDPRRTATAETADLHLPLTPGSDVLLFNGLLVYLQSVGALDTDWTDRHTTGLVAALAAARIDLGSPAGPDAVVATVAPRCGLDPAALASFYSWFAATGRTLTVFSQGVNQSAAGTDKVNAIINVHLATGRIGRPGMGPFSITGQPNAMGGREVGGLANQLAAHLRFDNPDDRDRLRRFWQAPHLAAQPGLKAVELFDAVLDGRVKALWIAGTNPADSLPRADRVRAALRACPFVVVADCWPTDTTRYAHVALPAATWGEKDGTVTNSERRISRQRRFRTAPGEARPDWWMFAQVARRMGFTDAFAWESPAALFREHAALSGFENAGERAFDIGALAALDDAAYETMEPVQWPLPDVPHPSWPVLSRPSPPECACLPETKGSGEDGRLKAGHDGYTTADHDACGFTAPRSTSPTAATVSEPTTRLFATGKFSTADRRARLIPTPYRPLRASPRPFRLNTGRVRDQWHTMTRTGRVPRLMQHVAGPSVALHPTDAARLGLAQDDLARLETDLGCAMLHVGLTSAQRPGELFVPMHWTDAFAAAGPVGRLVEARLDPHSGQPELKATPASLTRVPVALHGILLRRDGGTLPGDLHWTRRPLAHGQRYDFAVSAPITDSAALHQFADRLLPAAGDGIELHDPARLVLRRAILRDGRLHACLLLARDPASLPPPDAIAPLLGQPIPDHERWRVLAGGTPGSAPDPGPRVCACFGVGQATIRTAIREQALRTTAAIGTALRAGTNCGACLPELQALLRETIQPTDATAADCPTRPEPKLALAADTTD